MKIVAVVAGFKGDEFTQETTLADYKDFDGIKKATKVENSATANGSSTTRSTNSRLSTRSIPRPSPSPSDAALCCPNLGRGGQFRGHYTRS